MPAPPLSELIHRHVVPVLGLDWPLDLDTLFGRSAERTLEVGFGNGAFLEEQARRHPERDHLGIEVAWASVDLLLRRIERSGLTNVRVIRADARFILDRVLPQEAFDRAWVNHPDPWPKERHHERRIVQAPFLDSLQRVMTPEGILTIATDHADYAVWIGDVLEKQDWFQSTLPTAEVPELPGHLATKYQLKAREQGIENHFFVWRKVAPAPSPRPSEELPPVPNVTFAAAPELEDRDLLEGFEPNRIVELNEGIEVVVSMERAWRSQDGLQWMIETLVREGALSQQICVLVLRGDDGRVMVKTSSVGYPRGTWGVRRAVRRVAGILAARHPELKVASSNVGDL